MSTVSIDGKPVLTTRVRPRAVTPGTQVLLLDDRLESVAVTVTEVEPKEREGRTVGYYLHLADHPTFSNRRPVYFTARSWVEVLATYEQVTGQVAHADLTKVADHPARLLDAEDHHSAAAHLRDYEHDHGVTFAALDNNALEYVRQEWTRGVHGAAGTDLAGAVKDLLGLEG